MKFVDLFCGAGGVTSGIENAMHSGKKIAEVIACVNHDPLAIESHYSNHPNAVHYTEDIRTLNIEPLIELVNEHRYDYICLWASLECTNFSKAKGGLPRDADSRTLANDLLRYIILKGNQSDQKKFIGNSVVPIVAQKLIESIYDSLHKTKSKVA